MFKNITGIFLSVLLAVALVIGPVGVGQVSARAVTDQDIEQQETVARGASRLAIEEYTRLLLYLIIFKLETRLNA